MHTIVRSRNSPNGEWVQFEKKWDELPIEVLFFHRESRDAERSRVPCVSPRLSIACLTDDPMDTHGANVRGYLLSTLGSWPHHSDPERPAET
jgi:hypothetical protein